MLKQLRNSFFRVSVNAAVRSIIASISEVSEEKTVNKRFFKRSPTNASERCRVTQAPVHDTVVVREGDRALGVRGERWKE